MHRFIVHRPATPGKGEHRFRISPLLLKKVQTIVRRNAHQCSGYGVGRVMIAAVGGGDCDARGEEQEPTEPGARACGRPTPRRGCRLPTPEKQRVLKLTPAQPVRIAAGLAECCHPLMSVLFCQFDHLLIFMKVNDLTWISSSEARPDRSAKPAGCHVRVIGFVTQIRSSINTIVTFGVV